MDKELQKVKKNIDVALDKALYNVATNIGIKIQELYNQTVFEFYDSYTPHRYNRTFMTLRGSDAYRTINDPVAYEGGYKTGISVSPDNIPGNPYRLDKDSVFERTFVEGYHGYNNKEIKEWRTRKHIRELISKGRYHFKWYPEMKVTIKPAKELEKKIKKTITQKYVNQSMVDELTKIIS